MTAERGAAPAAAERSAALGLGGNLGDPAAAIAAALDALDACDGVRVAARSSLYRTPPWGDPDQPDFVNACALVATTLAPEALLALCLHVERGLGRAREKTRRWGPRLIDVDLLDYEGVTLECAALTLPHPRMMARAFVLVPLAEIAPRRVIAGRSVAEAAAAADAAGMTRLP